jgi:hypothetical protein
MAGYHVHEKAALMVTVPLALDAARGRRAAADWLFLSATAHYALLPLLFTAAEYPIKARARSAARPLPTRPAAGRLRLRHCILRGLPVHVRETCKDTRQATCLTPSVWQACACETFTTQHIRPGCRQVWGCMLECSAVSASLLRGIG